MTAERLEKIEQRVRDASERGGRNWYKTDVPELLRAVRVERERAERLERELAKASHPGFEDRHGPDAWNKEEVWCRACAVLHQKASHCPALSAASTQEDE